MPERCAKSSRDEISSEAILVLSQAADRSAARVLGGMSLSSFTPVRGLTYAEQSGILPIVGVLPTYCFGTHD